jgi:hypothetical protein
MFKSSVTIYLKSCFSILTNNYKQLFIFYFTDFKISVTNKFKIKYLFVDNYMLNKMLVSL